MFFTLIIATTIFSGACIAVMIGYRHWELKTGRVPMPEIREEFFSLPKLFAYALFCEKRYMLWLYAYARRHGERATRHAMMLSKSNPVLGKFSRVAEAVRGRNTIIKRESQSKFFKEISEHKEKIRNGKQSDIL